MPRSKPRRRLALLDASLPSPQRALERHVRELSSCARCTTMIGPVVAPPPVVSPVYLIGQAPGRHEGELGRPFAWTAGKTLFRWFERIGLPEPEFRARVYMAAVCRCFPGKAKGGGDRVPNAVEVAACSVHIEHELTLLRPALVIAVGRLAIAQTLGDTGPLAQLIGQERRATVLGHSCDVIALPHPSGVSAWFKIEPGKTLLERALSRIEAHPAWRSVCARRSGQSP